MAAVTNYHKPVVQNSLLFYISLEQNSYTSLSGC